MAPTVFTRDVDVKSVHIMFYRAYVETKAGKLGLPGMFRKKIGRTIDKVIQQKLGQSDLRLENVVVQPGLLTITVTPVPSQPSAPR